MKIHYIYITLYYIYCLINVSVGLPKGNDSEKYPVILIPGYGGSQSFAQITNDQKSEAFPLWLDMRSVLSTVSFTSYFSLVYDGATHKTRDNNNVKISFPGWGETWSIENLDTNPHFFSKYYWKMVEFLKRDPYYVTNKTIRGAPYDFRKGLNENGHVLQNIKSLVEETYHNNNNQPVVLIGHSMGCVYLLTLLNAQTSEWKRTYVKSTMFIAGPFGGTVKTMKAEASGDNMGIFLIDPISYRAIERSFPSTAMLLPDIRLWSPNETLIVTPNRNYTAHDIEQFFKDISHPDGYQMYLDNKPTMDALQAPTGIDEVYCIYGVNVSTPEQLIYKEPGFFRQSFPDQMPLIVPGNGDGTVNIRSLEVCQRWPGVKHIQLQEAEHKNILEDSRLMKILCQHLNLRQCFN